MPRAIVVVDLAFGDSGKGSMVDYLVRTTGSRTVIRYNGGPQAAHNVVASGGVHHTFAQFGSGTLAGASTILSKFMAIDPYAMANEAAHLQSLGIDDVWNRLMIDSRCGVITPVHQAANRLRERARGDAAHGTCGMGVGEAVSDSLSREHLTLRAADLKHPTAVAEILRESARLKRIELQHLLHADDLDASTLLDTRWIDVAVGLYADVAKAAHIASPQEIASRILGDETLIFEGAQGVLLDENFGFHPHTTWSTTTSANAIALLDEIGFTGDCKRLGLLRPYMTRHGNGPFPTEDISLKLDEPHNTDTGWPGRFRFGHFDAVLERYAIEVNGGIDALAVSCMDHIDRIPPTLCTSYNLDGTSIKQLPTPRSLQEQEQLTALLGRCQPELSELPSAGVADWIRAIETQLNACVEIYSTGPTAEDKRSSI